MVCAVARLKRIDAVVEADWWVEFAWLNHHIIIIHCHLLIVIFQLWSVGRWRELAPAAGSRPLVAGAAEDGSFFVLGRCSFLGSGVLVSCRHSLIASVESYPGRAAFLRSRSSFLHSVVLQLVHNTCTAPDKYNSGP